MQNYWNCRGPTHSVSDDKWWRHHPSLLVAWARRPKFYWIRRLNLWENRNETNHNWYSHASGSFATLRAGPSDTWSRRLRLYDPWRLIVLSLYFLIKAGKIPMEWRIECFSVDQRAVNPKRDWYETRSAHVRVTEWVWYWACRIADIATESDGWMYCSLNQTVECRY